MQLNITTDYAIRITMYLLEHKRIISSSELSNELEIPKTYIPKVTKKLEAAGIVKSHQGINGGVSITKQANEISMWDVIDATENTTMINKCLEENSCCNRGKKENCSVRRVYSFLQRAVEERLKSIKFEDLMKGTVYGLDDDSIR